MDIRKEAIQSLYEDMRRAFAEWNPVGVPYEQALGEYDGYVWQVFSRLHRGESVENIEKYLEYVVVDRMGLHYHKSIPEAAARFAEIYREWAESQ